MVNLGPVVVPKQGEKFHKAPIGSLLPFVLLKILFTLFLKKEFLEESIIKTEFSVMVRNCDLSVQVSTEFDGK